MARDCHTAGPPDEQLRDGTVFVGVRVVLAGGGYFVDLSVLMLTIQRHTKGCACHTAHMFAQLGLYGSIQLPEGLHSRRAYSLARTQLSLD